MVYKLSQKIHPDANKACPEEGTKGYDRTGNYIRKNPEMFC